MDAGLDLFGWLPGSLDLFARATALLGLAALMTWGFRTRAASARHLVWTTTFVLLIALPFAVHWLPALELPVMPDSAPGSVSGPVSSPSVQPATSAAFLGLPATSLFWLVWATGSFAALLSLGIGWARFSIWTRKGTVIDDPEWLEVVEDLRSRLGFRQAVRLIVSPKVDTAMVGGVIRPVVLLPPSAKHWSVERRSAVLIHELIHVRRHDPLRQLLGGVALALYWFHPLSWLAARLSVLTREQACEEGVLQLGTQPSEYASHLLELANRPSRSVVLALPLIQRSQLEQRIMAILAPSRPGPSLGVASSLCFLLVVCGVATAVLDPVSPVGAHERACQLVNPLPD